MKQLFARIELQLLAGITARTFGRAAPRLWTQPYPSALAAYAALTRDWMKENTLPPEELQTRMYREAARMGRVLGRCLFFLGNKSHARLVFLLYRGIGITMTGALPGAVEVTRCFFSQYYTPEMCRLISAMDDGMVSGIMGGGRFHFTRRMTEGCGSCRACLTRKDEQ